MEEKKKRKRPAFMDRTPKQRRLVNELVEQRNPGLLAAVYQTTRVLGSENRAFVDIPFERADPSAPLDRIGTVVSLLARDRKGVRILHKILAYGLEEYAADDRVRCAHCGTAIDGYPVTVNPQNGIEETWWHRATGYLLCANQETKAVPENGVSPGVLEDVMGDVPFPAGFSD